MNNPFLSDRNIFSKVVNPLKKKTQDKKEDPRPADPPRLPEKPKEALDTYNPYKNDRPQANIAPKPNPFTSQTQKLSFGPPNEQEKAFEKKMSNPRHSQEESESETHVYSYGKDSLKFQSEAKGTEKWRGGQGRQQVLSPPQEYRFEEFRRQNNLTDCSPINAPRLSDSEFLNIDAMGDDLNKFLAESKNQEELCKILGIERNNRKEQPRPVEITASRGGKGFEERGQNSRGFNEFPRSQQESKAESFSAKPVPVQNVQDSQNYMPRVPAIFSKERKVDNVRAEQFAPPSRAPVDAPPARLQETTLKSSNEHVPTFNFGGLDQEHSTVSQEDEEANFSGVRGSRKGKERKDKEGRDGKGEEALEVFNYSKVGGGQGGESLQAIVEREMRELSLNGKYRTFLSASEKITTVRYKLDPL